MAEVDVNECHKVVFKLYIRKLLFIKITSNIYVQQPRCVSRYSSRRPVNLGLILCYVHRAS
jgi:hypothetical protein